MSRKLSKKIKDSCAAMLSITALALFLSFVVAPMFAEHTAYIRLACVGFLVVSASCITRKIVVSV